MADDGFGYDLALIDHVTREAHTMGRSIDDLAEAIDELSKKFEKSNKHVKDAAEHTEHLGGEVRKLAAEYLSLKAAQEVVRFAAEAADFREDTTLAYAAVKGTAEQGEAVFQTIDKIARQVHMPAEKAHEMAQSLMLEGLNDTALIGKIIETKAALIRTGQIRGAEKLQSIIERSIVSGHLEAGKGGKKLAGLGIDAALAQELGKGQTTVEDGLEKITRSILDGPIGKTAEKKFGLEEFGADISNAFRGAAQSADLGNFNAALGELDQALIAVTGETGPVGGFFQMMLDDAAIVIHEIAGLTDSIGGALAMTDKAMPTMAGDWKEFGKIAGEGISGVRKILGGLVTFIYGGALVAIDTLVSGVKEIGAAVAFAADVIAHPFDSFDKQKARYEAFKKTEQDIHEGWKKDVAGIGDLEIAMLDGSAAATKMAAGEQAVEFHASRAGKSLEFMAAKQKEVKQHALGPEDLVLLPFLGAPGRSLLDDTGGGFANRMGAGLPSTIDVSGFSTASMTGPMARGASAAPPPVSGSGRSVSLTWTGNVYTGQNETADHLRPVVESALADAFERLQLELGG